MSSYPAPNPSPPPLGIYNEQNWYSKSDPTGPVGPQGVQGGIGTPGAAGSQGFQGWQGPSAVATVPLYYQRGAFSLGFGNVSQDLGIALVGVAGNCFEMTFMGTGSGTLGSLDVSVSGTTFSFGQNTTSTWTFKYTLFFRLTSPTAGYANQVINWNSSNQSTTATAANTWVSGNLFNMTPGSNIVILRTGTYSVAVESVAIVKYV